VRDHLYLWRNSANSLVASGIEFRDFLPPLRDAGGVILLAHRHNSAVLDTATGLGYVPQHGLTALATANVYDFGDFVWLDYPVGRFPAVAPDDLVDLAEFAKTGSPRGPIVLPSVGNRMLAFAHDDGWRLSLFYADWEPVRALLHSLAGRLTNASIDTLDRPSGSEAIRVTATGVHACPGTIDIDGLMNGWAAAEGRPTFLL
jgi:hypothetical protein